MSTTATKTTTFTVADIRKVIENFAADYTMIGEITGLRTRDYVSKDIADLTQFANDGYLVRVTLYQLDKDGNPLNVSVYEVSESAAAWKTGNPGGNLWPVVSGSSLQLIATLTDAWFAKSDASQQQYVKDKGLHGSWAKSGKSMSLAGLKSSEGQKYASNGYGWARTNYSK